MHLINEWNLFSKLLCNIFLHSHFMDTKECISVMSAGAIISMHGIIIMRQQLNLELSPEKVFIAQKWMI